MSLRHFWVVQYFFDLLHVQPLQAGFAASALSSSAHPVFDVVADGLTLACVCFFTDVLCFFTETLCFFADALCFLAEVLCFLVDALCFFAKALCFLANALC